MGNFHFLTGEGATYRVQNAKMEFEALWEHEEKDSLV